MSPLQLKPVVSHFSAHTLYAASMLFFHFGDFERKGVVLLPELLNRRFAFVDALFDLILLADSLAKFEGHLLFLL